MKQAVANVTVYQQLHQDRPGFFDTAVNTGPTSANIPTHITLVSHASTVEPLLCEQKIYKMSCSHSDCIIHTNMAIGTTKAVLFILFHGVLIRGILLLGFPS